MKLSDHERRANGADAQAPEQERRVILRERDGDDRNRAEREPPGLREARTVPSVPAGRHVLLAGSYSSTDATVPPELTPATTST